MIFKAILLTACIFFLMSIPGSPIAGEWDDGALFDGNSVIVGKASCVGNPKFETKNMVLHGIEGKKRTSGGSRERYF